MSTPDTDHDRHRRRKPKRAGTRDDQHGDRGDDRIGETRLRTKDHPGGESGKRGGDHQRHEPGSHLIGKALNRRPAPLRLRHQLHDLGKQRIAAHLVRAHEERAALIERACDDFFTRVLADG
jgi:hypothetical protein